MPSITPIERYMDTHGGRNAIHAAEASELVRIAGRMDADSSGCCTSGTKGHKHLSQVYRDNPDAFDSDAKDMIRDFLGIGRPPAGMIPVDPDPSVNPINGPRQPSKVLLKWNAESPTFHVHWYPQKETRPGGDPINNLYAPNGALQIYDNIFGARSREYELSHFRVAVDGDPRKGWWGHCNNASIVSSIFEAPKYVVVRNGYEISPEQVKAWLVCISDSFVKKTEFIGKRHNEDRDDPNEPYPSVVIKGLKKWCTEQQIRYPIMADLDNRDPVWNYPFDAVEVPEFKTPPRGFNARELPEGGTIKYYEINLGSTGYPEQKRHLQAWIQYDDDGRVLEEGWIQGDDPKVNIDFLWRVEPTGDLFDRGTWVTNPSKQANPHILAENIYDIYMESIGRA